MKITPSQFAWLFATLLAIFSTNLTADSNPFVELEEATSAPYVSKETDGYAIQDARLPIPGGALLIEDGFLFPLLHHESDLLEVLFVGQARFEFETQDEIEAYQVELLTGRRSLNVAVSRFVLAVGDAETLSPLIKNATLQKATDAQLRGARVLSSRWFDDELRQAAGVLTGIARARWNPAHRGFLALWCHTTELDDFLYRVDPSSQEPLTIGPLKLEERSSEDDGTELSARSWVSLAPDEASKGATAGRGTPGFEPTHYEIQADIPAWEADTRRMLVGNMSDVETLTDRVYRDIEGSMVVDFEATVGGSRVVSFTMHPELGIDAVQDGDGSPLPFLNAWGEAIVLLPVGADAGERFSLEVDFSGPMLLDIRDGHMQSRAPIRWHPHIGAVDRATYELEFEWPKGYQLFSSGDRVESGERDGRLYLQSELPIPVFGVGFEMGHFEVHTSKVGDIDVTVAFSTLFRFEDDIELESIGVARSSLAYFSRLFGEFPLKSMDVVVVPQFFGQGKLGFVTLPLVMGVNMRDAASYGWRDDSKSAQDTRIELIAHEIAHQWWGNRVGWDSYRDQWLSEALADFAALLYLEKAHKSAAVVNDQRARTWRSSLAQRTNDGRAYADLGPVVLGTRLARSHGSGVYSSVVYDKGALVFSMLAQLVGREPLIQALKRIADEVDHGVIDNVTFMQAIQNATGVKLKTFYEQFVLGVQRPRIDYSYKIEPADEGWVINGRATATSHTAHRFEAIKAESGHWVIVRRTLSDPSELTPDFTLKVPFQAALQAPTSSESRNHGRQLEAGVGGSFIFRAPTTTFSIPMEREPKELFLDQRGELFVTLQHLQPGSQQAMRQAGLDFLYDRKFQEAEATFNQALELPALGVPKQTEAETRLALARLYLTMERTEPAREQLERVDILLDEDDSFAERERAILWSRVEIIDGKGRSAFKRMKGYLVPPVKELDVLDYDEFDRWQQQDAESFATFAVAAILAREKIWATRACDEAVRRGANMDQVRAQLR